MAVLQLHTCAHRYIQRGTNKLFITHVLVVQLLIANIALRKGAPQKQIWTSAGCGFYFRLSQKARKVRAVKPRRESSNQREAGLMLTHTAFPLHPSLPAIADCECA